MIIMKYRFKFFITVFLILIVELTIAQRTASDIVMKLGGFRASVVKIDITPEVPKMLLGYAARKSTGVHDHIFHRIVALDDGVKQFFWFRLTSV